MKLDGLAVRPVGMPEIMMLTCAVRPSIGVTPIKIGEDDPC